MTFSSARDMIENHKLNKEPEYYRDMITMSLDTLKEKYDQATSAVCQKRISILGLTWDCVDFDRSIITIDEQMQLHQEKGCKA